MPFIGIKLYIVYSLQRLHSDRQAYPIKFMTTRCRMMWAKIKSANPRSGVIPKNCDLFCGFDWRRRQTESRNGGFSQAGLQYPQQALLTAQHEAADGGDESGEE